MAQQAEWEKACRRLIIREIILLERLSTRKGLHRETNIAACARICRSLCKQMFKAMASVSIGEKSRRFQRGCITITALILI